MKMSVGVLLSVVCATTVVQASRLQGTSNACQKRDLALRTLVQEKIANLGVPCEEMCKKMGAYPDCQCPGFAGQPSSSDDERACVVKYCQDPENPCPTDSFVTCVAELTKVSALQWDTIFDRLDSGAKQYASMLQKSQAMRHAQKHATASKTMSCQARDTGVRVLLQEKIANLGVPCEEMCKKMGAYPDCQCPGFAGQPSSSDDERACVVKYCQDPENPCPTDSFVTCVAELTKVSALQWDSVFTQLDQGAEALTRTVRAMRNATSARAAVRHHKEKPSRKAIAK